MPGRDRPYRLSPLAEADMEAIWLYSFENWSLAQADRYHNEVVTVFHRLAAGEIKGRKVEIREGYFKYAVGAHFIYYRHLDSGLAIIRILHQRMDANRHL